MSATMHGHRALVALSILVLSLILVFIAFPLVDWPYGEPVRAHAPKLNEPSSHPTWGSGRLPNPPRPGSSKDGAVGDDDEDDEASTGSGDQHPQQPPAADLECANFPDTSNVLVVMKTGASEAYTRVPNQLMTLLKCLPEFYIYSNLEQKIVGQQLYDSLDAVLNETKHGNGDFDLYRQQQACSVDQDSCNAISDNVAKGGWNLDKYKNVHIAEKVYAKRPGYHWYLFVDADTYVLFPTLIQWLSHLDYSKPHYLGSKVLIGGYPFAHGGSGYLVSQGVMRGIGNNHGIANRLEAATRKTCCGDFMFAKAVENTTGTKVHNVAPVINGEKPITLPLGPDTWCRPLVTMHHMNSEEISSFWAWESTRYNTMEITTDPVTRYKDVFHAFVESNLMNVREDWNNLSKDRFYLVQGFMDRKFSDSDVSRAKKDDLSPVEVRAHESFESCNAACQEEPKCLQYRWQDGLCVLNWSIRLGRPMKSDKVEKNRWMSGWNLARIEDFVQQQGECGEAKWPTVP